MKTFKIKVPATTANLGSSFDVVGVAFDLYCYITVNIGDEFNIVVKGQGEDSIPTTQENLIYKVMVDLCKHKGIEEPKFSLEIDNHIPVNSGLGSSAAAIIGGLYAANLAFCDNLCSYDELLKFALKYESHPDNLAAALFGGLVISATVNKEAYYKKFEEFENSFTDKSFIAIISDSRIETEASREELLKANNGATHNDYVMGLNCAVANIIAFIKGDFKSLISTMDDKIWHQRQREKSNPYMREMFKAAISNKAYGVSLSGSGPCVLAICDDNKSQAIKESMLKVLNKRHEKAVAYILKADNEGVRSL